MQDSRTRVRHRSGFPGQSGILLHLEVSLSQHLYYCPAPLTSYEHLWISPASSVVGSVPTPRAPLATRREQPVSGEKERRRKRRALCGARWGHRRAGLAVARLRRRSRRSRAWWRERPRGQQEPEAPAGRRNSYSFSTRYNSSTSVGTAPLLLSLRRPVHVLTTDAVPRAHRSLEGRCRSATAQGAGA